MPPSDTDSTSQELVSRLKSLSGEFSLSVAERKEKNYMLALLAVMSLGAFFISYVTGTPAHPFRLGVFFFDGVAIGAFVIWGVASQDRLHRRYFFKDGTVGQMTREGKVLWKEDLSTPVEAERRLLKGRVISLTLYWPGRRRTLGFYRSLAEQLDRPAASARLARRAEH